MVSFFCLDHFREEKYINNYAENDEVSFNNEQNITFGIRHRITNS